jgi:hypothetical protein
VSEPWEAYDIEDQGEQEERAWGVRGPFVVDCGDFNAPNEANARVIAAAPDLLAALCAYAEWHGPACEHATRDDCPIDGCPGRPIDDAVNAAIAKAQPPALSGREGTE